MTASYVDRTDPPTYPRWFGYLNACFALLELPPWAVVILNDGPLAWNGIFAFWFPLEAFGAWMITVTVVMLRSISAEQAVDRPLATAAA